ncbi:MAG: Wzz/FepE/Etk N-terminal domain-containing protein [Chloroflexi bacterium]|nr:Wzz/FepE/Etk N-terminal domain-containing protein [Chloroflexota bacterium]
MNSEVTQVHSDRAPYDDEISLLHIASFILRRRLLILVSTFAGTLFALVGALRTPLEYTATASFLPHGGDQGGFPGVAGLAQQFGFSIPRSGSAERSPEFYRDLLQSREILDGVVRSAVEVVTATGVTTMDLAEHFEIEGATPDERRARTRRHLAEGVISVSVARGTGVVTVSVLTDEPELSAAIGRRLLDLIATFDVQTRQSQASAERAFAEERLGQLQGEIAIAEDSLKAFLVENRQFSNSPQLTFEHDRLQRHVVMRQELVTAMAQAYEQARIDEVRNTPVITVIDQPEPPALPDPRGRLRKLLLGLTLGMVVGFGLAFIREFGERAKTEESQAYGEFRGVLKDAKRNLFGLRRSRRPDPNPVDSDA